MRKKILILPFGILPVAFGCLCPIVLLYCLPFCTCLLFLLNAAAVAPYCSERVIAIRIVMHASRKDIFDPTDF